MTKLPAPTFGKKEPGKPYTKRPCAFGIAVDEAGRIACVKITRPSYVRWDLPGGMQEKGETIKGALMREYAEETGLKIKVGELIARTRQYLVKPDGDRRDNRSSYFEVEIRKKSPAGKAEDDHKLVWLDPVEAQRRVRDDAAAWAIAAWLRARTKSAD